MRKVAIIGAGPIAQRFKQRIEVFGDRVCFSMRSNHVGPSFKELWKEHRPDAVCVAISTRDNGEAERDYLLQCIEAGVPAITSAKGALAHHAHMLKPHFHRIGFNASVGGGTGILHYLRNRHPNTKLVQVYAVLNGTLGFIFDEVHHNGRTLEDACAEAKKLNYAEPGADGPLNLINEEHVDVIRKTCVTFNTVLSRREFLTPSRLGSFSQTLLGLNSLVSEGQGYRLVVSFSNHPSVSRPVFFGPGFEAKVEDWHISGGFRRVEDLPNFRSWFPNGVENAIHIIEGKNGQGGRYTKIGAGAGPDPTVRAMIADYNRLCP